MALTKNITHLGMTASGAYIRPEVFARQGAASELGKPYQAVVKVYASIEAATDGTGAFKDFNCTFHVGAGEAIDTACYAALKAMPEMDGATDC